MCLRCKVYRKNKRQWSVHEAEKPGIGLKPPSASLFQQPFCFPKPFSLAVRDRGLDVTCGVTGTYVALD